MLLKQLYRRYIAPFSGKYPFFGHWIFFPKNSLIINVLQHSGDFEPQTRQLLWQFARKNTTFFDVGANIGILSVPILSLTQDVEVVSFEPSPAVHPYLKKTWTQSPFQSRWHIIEKAVGNYVGTTSFSQHKKLGDDAFDGIRQTHRKGETETVEVSITTLDAVWRERATPSVSVIKIDVEGAELAVLEGAAACIEACSPIIITEWNRINLSAYNVHPTALWEWAKANKYSIFMIPNLYQIDSSHALDAASSLLEYCILIPNKMPIERRF
jgi:FkbM family methyltransferase